MGVLRLSNVEPKALYVGDDAVSFVFLGVEKLWDYRNSGGRATVFAPRIGVSGTGIKSRVYAPKFGTGVKPPRVGVQGSVKAPRFGTGTKPPRAGVQGYEYSPKFGTGIKPPRAVIQGTVRAPKMGGGLVAPRAGAALRFVAPNVAVIDNTITIAPILRIQGSVKTPGFGGGAVAPVAGVAAVVRAPRVGGSALAPPARVTGFVRAPQVKTVSPIFIDVPTGKPDGQLAQPPYSRKVAWSGDYYNYGSGLIYRTGSGGNDSSDGNDAYLYGTESANLDQYGKITITTLTDYPGPGIVLRVTSPNSASSLGVFAQIGRSNWRIFTARPGVSGRTIVDSGTYAFGASGGIFEFYLRPDDTGAIMWNGQIVKNVLFAAGVIPAGLNIGFQAGNGSNRISRVELGNNGPTQYT